MIISQRKPTRNCGLEFLKIKQRRKNEKN